MNRKWLKRILIGLVFSPCAFCLWQIYVFFGSAALFRLSLPLYPAARAIGTDSTVNTAESDYQAVYYWTDVSIHNVREYYVDLTSSGKSSTEVLVYEGLYEAGDNPQRSCDWYVDAPPSCVEIRLLDFGESGQVLMPNALSVKRQFSYGSPTPQMSIIENLQGGTLIIYGYYTPEM